jgi:hypothetical protein
VLRRGDDRPSTRGRVRRRRGVLSVLGLTAVALAGLAAAPAATAQARSASPFVALPVVPCASDFGVSPPPEAPSSPNRLTVLLAPTVASRLSFYSDGFQTILAPRGWACHGLVAADGGKHLSAFPAGSGDPLSGNQSSSTGTGVTVLVPSPGTGQVASVACALFPQAQTAGGSCSATKPAAETVDRPTDQVALFHDPPHVAGSGTPSGGSAPADGAVIYVPTQGPGGAALTCTLASRGSTLCPSVINDFLARFYPMVPPGQLSGQ